MQQDNINEKVKKVNNKQVKQALTEFMCLSQSKALEVAASKKEFTQWKELEMKKNI